MDDIYMTRSAAPSPAAPLNTQSNNVSAINTPRMPNSCGTLKQVKHRRPTNVAFTVPLATSTDNSLIARKLQMFRQRMEMRHGAKTVTSVELLLRIQERLDGATLRRQTYLASRLTQLRQQFEIIRQRLLLHEQKLRLKNLRLKTSIIFSLRAASLKRQLLLQQRIEQCAAIVERAQGVALMQRLKRCLILKKSYSASFAETLGEIPEFDLERTFGNEAEAFTHQPTLSASHRRIQSDDATSDHSESSTTSSSTSLALGKHMVRPMSPGSTEEMRYLTDLAYVFGDQMPTITRNTLRELSLEAIVSDVQLRHNMIFDPNLEFRPNDDGERGDMKRMKVKSFWNNLETEVTGKCGTPSFRRIPVLLNEVKEIMLELVANEEYKKSVEIHMDIPLLAQQMEHGVFDAVALINFISEILKAHCAPARDCMVDEMVRICQEGNMIASLKLCFEVLERMKLDIANDQLRRLRPYVLENAVQYEWDLFKSELKEGSVSLKNTLRWLRGSISKDNTIAMSDRFLAAFVDLVDNLGSAQVLELPETLRLDQGRLVSFHNDWQDITIMACLMMIYKQVVGTNVSDTHMKEIKKQLWTLLNEADTTMTHITLHLMSCASKFRGRNLTEAETAMLHSLVDKTLGPNNQVYELIRKRVGSQLVRFLKSREITTTEELKRVALAEMEEELTDLSKKLRVLVDHNKATHVKVYNQILETFNKDQ
jgi:hypothetical protein